MEQTNDLGEWIVQRRTISNDVWTFDRNTSDDGSLSLWHHHQELLLMTTVLITGCSTGFGRETAAYFLEQCRIASNRMLPSVGCCLM